MPRQDDYYLHAAICRYADDYAAFIAFAVIIYIRAAAAYAAY